MVLGCAQKNIQKHAKARLQILSISSTIDDVCRHTFCSLPQEVNSYDPCYQLYMSTYRKGSVFRVPATV